MPFENVGKDITEGFLTDIEKGGWIGKSRDDGQAVFRVYGSLKTKGEKENKEYKKNLKRYQRKRMLEAIFPKKERLISDEVNANNQE